MIKYYWLLRYALTIDAWDAFGCWVEYQIRADKVIADKYEHDYMTLVDDYSHNTLLSDWKNSRFCHVYCAIAIKLDYWMYRIRLALKKAIATFGGAK